VLFGNYEPRIDWERIIVRASVGRTRSSCPRTAGAPSGRGRSTTSRTRRSRRWSWV